MDYHVLRIWIQLLDQKECLSLQAQQLTLDCKMHQQKSVMIQNQIRELQAERDQVRKTDYRLIIQTFPSFLSTDFSF